MSLRAFLIAMTVAVAVARALAIDYMVGDVAGWDLNVSYTAWAGGKDFRVGDTIVFMYKTGYHNVLAVNGADFRRCTSTDPTAVPYTSGHDVFRLDTPRNLWYICDIKDHCSKGMKLSITVSAADGPTPTPMPGSSPGTSDAAGEISPLKSSLWILVVMAAYRMIIA